MPEITDWHDKKPMTDTANINDRHDRTPMTDMISDRHNNTPMTRMTESNSVQRPRSHSRSNGVGFKLMGCVRLWGDVFNLAGTHVSQ